MSTTFIVLSFILLVAVAGYRINWLNLSISQTSLVWLKGNEKNVTIYFDGKKISDDLPLRINYVNEGWREVVITKKGYHDWKKSFYADTGQAYEFREIVMFASDAKPEVVTDKELIASLGNVILPVNISVEDGELLANDRLVSRFSTDPSSFEWYKDGKHILYQIGKEIRVIDTSGDNDLLLVRLENEVATKMRLINGGKYLLYSDGDQVKKVRIR